VSRPLSAKRVSRNEYFNRWWSRFPAMTRGLILAELRREETESPSLLTLGWSQGSMSDAARISRLVRKLCGADDPTPKMLAAKLKEMRAAQRRGSGL
jgi:hypothetical protein